MELMRKFTTLCRRFVKAKKGNVAIIFAFAMVPTMVLVGGAVDYGMAIKTKSQLSATLDSAMLAAMLKYSEDSSVDYDKIISDYIDKNYRQADKNRFNTTVEVNSAQVSDEGEMTTSINVTVPTSFLKLVAIDDFKFSVHSAVMVGGSSIEVALVLDNTGSMSGAKIQALKDAANDLLDILLPEGADNSDEKIKFSVVPFADYVNIGEKIGSDYVVVGRNDRSEQGTDIPENYTRTWWVDGSNNCWNEYPDSTEECTPVKEWRVCHNDGVPYDCYKTVDWDCTGDPGEPVQHCEWVPGKQKTKTYKWYGCMGSRRHDLNTRDDGYDAGVPGIMKDYCKNKIAPVTRLTALRDDIVSGLAKMKAKRNTYIPSGLAWGWRSLSPGAPFADGASYQDGAVRKVIVLMTDGANTKSMKKWTGHDTDNNASEVWGHSNGNKAQANTYTTELCNNIKAQKIMVYTIGFDIAGESGIEDIMKACAGNGGQYYDANNSTELADAFREIGQSLLNLRLTK